MCRQKMVVWSNLVHFHWVRACLAEVTELCSLCYIKKLHETGVSRQIPLFRCSDNAVLACNGRKEEGVFYYKNFNKYNCR